MQTVDVISMMDQQAERAAAAAATPRSKNGVTVTNTFLMISDKQKAIIRPLYNLDAAIVLPVHYKFNRPDPKLTVNAVCSKEIGQQCQHCQDAANDKKLSVATAFMLPVYVYRIEHTEKGVDRNNVAFKAGEAVMYRDENDQMQPVHGVRILKLTFFGSIATVANTFRSRYKRGDNITHRDFSIERIGGDQATRYILDPEDPSDFQPKIIIPTPERIRERILEACPPTPLAGATSNIPVPAVLQTIKEESSNEPAIPEF